MNLTVKVIIGMVLGIIAGLAINFAGLNAPGSIVNDLLVNGVFDVAGKMFVNALKMLVVPLVVFSLICGVCGIGDIRLLGRIGAKSFGLYLLTTAIAVAAALVLSGSLAIGKGMDAVTSTAFSAREVPSISQVLIDIVPSNPVNAMAQGNMLSIIFFAILLGISLLMVGKKAGSAIAFFEVMNEAMMKMVNIIMILAPYAVFALIAKAMAELGVDLLVQLIGYVAALIAVLLFHLLITLQLVLKLFSGLSPLMFLRKIRNALVFAFSTSSSSATIPVTLRTVTERMGVNNSVASFTVPFGATINMDGTAIMQGVASVFIANLYNVELGITGYLTVILMAVLASVGTAGVPGVGLIMLSMVFVQVGLPVEGIGLILGVDRLLDMIRTAVNVSGDAVVSLVVAKSESRLDIQVFEDPEAGSLHTHQVRVAEENQRELARVVAATHDK